MAATERSSARAAADPPSGGSSGGRGDSGAKLFPGDGKTAGSFRALTVAQIVSQIRLLIERQFPSAVWVEGELSNCTYASSGHIYFSLVDEEVTDRFGQRLVLPCAFFRGFNQHLKFKLTDGLKVLCLGQVTTFEGKGQYQLKVVQVEPRGIGALQLAFDQLKKRLAAEGLFDEARKRPLPSLLERVALITSPAGSAIHDMISKLRGWFDVVILPVKVQGEGASTEIAEAIDLANRLRIADVLIVGRGGGSVEDLWAFNEEPVARAIARSGIPVISAVGHQDDWFISDYVADRRASTPTDAAKLLVHDREAFATEARELIERLLEGMRIFLDDQSREADQLAERLRLLHPRHHVEQHLQRAAALEQRLIRSTHHALERSERALAAFSGRLQALSPLAVLARGYSVTFRLPKREVVTEAAALQLGDAIEILLAKGQVTGTVSATQERNRWESDGPTT